MDVVEIMKITKALSCLIALNSYLDFTKDSEPNLLIIICASGVPASKWGILPDPSLRFITYLIFNKI